MKKRILSTLLSLAVFASVSLTSSAMADNNAKATPPVYGSVSGVAVDSVGKDVSMDGGIYGTDWLPVDDELDIISLRVPSRLVFAVYNAENNPNDPKFTSVDNYYIENLGKTSIKVSLHGVQWKNADGSTDTDAKVTLVPEDVEPESVDQLALRMKFTGTDANTKTVPLVGDASVNVPLGIVGGRSVNSNVSSAANVAKFNLEGTPFTTLPESNKKIKSNFNVKLNFEIVK